MMRYYLVIGSAVQPTTTGRDNMSYQINIAGNVKTSTPEIVSIGSHVHYRRFNGLRRMSMPGAVAHTELTGTVIAMDVEGDDVDFTVLLDAADRMGRTKGNFSCNIAGADDDRIVEIV